jgi:light-harvesting complex 1 beta chain
MAHQFADSHVERGTSPLEGFGAIFIVLFIAFMAVAMVSTLLAQDWRTLLPGAEGARTMLAGVKSAVYTVISQLS